jgi:hypothetical protein
VGTRDGLDIVAKRKIPAPNGMQIPEVNPVARGVFCIIRQNIVYSDIFSRHVKELTIKHNL